MGEYPGIPRIVCRDVEWLAATVISTLKSTIPGRSRDRWLAGVAGGIAARLGVQPVYVRAAFVAFGLLGFAAYVLLLVISIDSLVDDEPSEEASPDKKLALLLMTVGGLLLAHQVGLLASFMLPVALVLFGAAALWDRSTPLRRSRLTRLVAPNIGGAPTIGRTVGGIALLVVGLAVLLPGIEAIRRAGWLVLGVVITLAGALLVFGPWLYRLAGELRSERSRRIRADARAEVAAHLHDSVLQTLALIQRAGDDPRRMVTLARSQERDLRAWLFGDKGPTAELEPALTQVADRVEHDHNVPINVIVVGEAAMDERVDALVAAAREAMVNAARHSGTAAITVYVEVGHDSIDAWITDQGTGFDPAAVRDGAAGIRGSIVDRMNRRGGSADVSSGSEGTEVHLRLPVTEAVK